MYTSCASRTGGRCPTPLLSTGGARINATRTSLRRREAIQIQSIKQRRKHLGNRPAALFGSHGPATSRGYLLNVLPNVQPNKHLPEEPRVPVFIHSDRKRGRLLRRQVAIREPAISFQEPSGSGVDRVAPTWLLQTQLESSSILAPSSQDIFRLAAPSCPLKVEFPPLFSFMACGCG